MPGAAGAAVLLRAKDNGKVPEVIIASSILCLVDIENYSSLE